MDKDTLVSALNTAHDTHLLAIDNKEDDIARRTSRDMATIMENMLTSELGRNRKKVSEINKYVELQRSEVGISSGATSPYL